MGSKKNLLKYAEIFLEAANHPRAEYMREYMKNRYHSKREEIANRLGGKCNSCGTKKGPWHFDHKKKKNKTMRASDLHSVNSQKFEQELKALQLLCAECHKKKTKDSWDFSTPKSKHGTYWMYRKHECRCKKCVDAYKTKQKEWRDNRKKNASDEEPLRSRIVVEDLINSIERTLEKLNSWKENL